MVFNVSAHRYLSEMLTGCAGDEDVPYPSSAAAAAAELLSPISASVSMTSICPVHTHCITAFMLTTGNYVIELQL